MVNAADQESIKKRAKEDKFNKQQEIMDVRFILGTPQGRRYIWRHMSSAGIFTTSFTGNSSTFFNEGKRDVGLKMLAEVTDVNPDAYVLMMKEAREGNHE